MILDTVQSMFLLILGVMAILILLRILFIVHRQTKRVKELEQRMKLMEKTEDADVVASTETGEVK